MSATSIPERRIDRLAMAGRTSTAYLNKLLPLLLFWHCQAWHRPSSNTRSQAAQSALRDTWASEVM